LKSSLEDIAQVVDAAKGLNFLTNGAEAMEGGLLAALPEDAVAISSVDSKNNEIITGQELARAGCKSLLVRQACIGDYNWDLKYARFAIDSLTSKANPEFQITDISSSSKGGSGDFRQSFGADSTGRALQNAASVQQDIMAARGGPSDPFPNHPGSMPRR
jgi:hypothetical protein